jgi:hypothetical protein
VSGTVCCCNLVVIVQVGSFQLECEDVEENPTVIVCVLSGEFGNRDEPTFPHSCGASADTLSATPPKDRSAVPSPATTATSNSNKFSW